MSNLTEHKHRH